MALRKWKSRAVALGLCAALAVPAPVMAQEPQGVTEHEAAGQAQEGVAAEPAALAETEGDIVISDENSWAVFAADISNNNGYAGKRVKLAKDLNFSGVAFPYVSGEFKGEFDGCGHSISGMEKASSVFREIASSGIVKNLTVQNGNFNYCGTIFGDNYGLVDNCHRKNVNNGYGIGGYNYGTVMNCSNVDESDCGLVSYNYGKIYNSYNLGKVNNGICSTSSGAGSIIENCYNAGMVSNAGIASTIKESATIKNSYCSQEVLSESIKFVQTKTLPFTLEGCDEAGVEGVTMRSADFAATLNANREGHPDWLEWEMRTEESQYPVLAKRISVLDGRCQVQFSGESPEAPTFAYDGKEKKPEVSVTCDGVALEEGKDYVLVYQNNTNAGTAQATVQGMGKYMDTVTLPYTITPVDISTASAAVKESGLVYDGTKKEPGFTVQYGGRVLEEGADYQVEYKNNTNAGTAQATITGTGNYTGSMAQQEFVIGKAERELQGTDYETMGSDPEFDLDITYTGDGLLSYQSSNEKVAVVDPKGKVTLEGAGTAIITVTAPETKNYKGKSIEVSVTVNKYEQRLDAVTSYAKVYGDAPFSLNVRHNGDGTLTYTSSNKNVADVDQTGKVTIKGAGAAELTVSASETKEYSGKTLKITVTVSKLGQVLETQASYSKVYGDAAFALNVKHVGDGTLTYASSNKNIADVDQTGKVTIKGAGSAELTISASETANCSGKTIKVPVSVQKAAQGLTVKKATISKTYGSKSFSLGVTRTGNGTLTYSSSNKKVASVDKNGKVSLKGTGIAVITVTAPETSNYQKASIKVTIKSSPKKMSVKSLSASKGKKLTVKWKKDSKATGYEIQYSTDKKFKKSVKKKKITKNKTTSFKITKLAAGKRYYVRIRATKTAKLNGKKQVLYGAWSSPKRSAKIKK